MFVVFLGRGQLFVWRTPVSPGGTAHRATNMSRVVGGVFNRLLMPRRALSRRLFSSDWTCSWGMGISDTVAYVIPLMGYVQFHRAQPLMTTELDDFHLATETKPEIEYR